MDSSLRRNVPFFKRMHCPYLLPTPISPSFLSPPTSCPSLGALLDVCWWVSSSLLVFGSLLRGTAGWVEVLEGSFRLAKCWVPTAKALYLFIFWVLQTPNPPNSVQTQAHTYEHNTIKKWISTNSCKWEKKWKKKRSRPTWTHPYTCFQEGRQANRRWLHTPAQLPICFLWGITLFSLKCISSFKSSSEAYKVTFHNDLSIQMVLKQLGHYR